MTIARARIIKAMAPEDALAPTRPAPVTSGVSGRRIPRAVLEGRAEAARIVADAEARVGRLAADARAAAAVEAREAEAAKLAAAFLLLRSEDEHRAERDLNRVVELAVLLAERLVGESLGLDPARVGHLAVAVLAEARGARRVRIETSPDDAAALASVLGELGHAVDVTADPALGRGSLVVHTDLGRIDGRLEIQLERLATALREALR